MKELKDAQIDQQLKVRANQNRHAIQSVCESALPYYTYACARLHV